MARTARTRRKGSTVLQFVRDIGLTAVWTLIGVALLFLSTILYDKLDPLELRNLIKEGNVAAGVLLGALTIGVALIVSTVLR